MKAPDGSPVELYAALPFNERDAELVHSAMPKHASILELGAGTGRVTRPLTERGHTVVAVDQSPEMLAHITWAARTVQADIQTLDLGERFDAVLLMSYLVGYGDREPLLAACARHIGPDGCVIVQRETPEWFTTAGPSEWEHDGIRFRMHSVSRPAENILSASVDTLIGEGTWTHTFTSRLFGDEEIDPVLGAAGLRFDRFLDETREWIRAVPRR